MRFAVPYYNENGGKWMESADEIIIKYEANGELALTNFLKDYSNHRIIIDIVNFDEFSHNTLNPAIFTSLKTEHHLTNWALRFNHPVPEVEAYLKDSGIFAPDLSFFFKMPAETFEQFDRYLHSGVSDIYITNSLAFDLERLRIKITESPLPPPYIRVYPNICQSYWGDLVSIKSFFIRPEDIEDYDFYIDTFEIYAETLPQIAKAPTVFSIYHDSKTWYGDLKEYLINCNVRMYNPFMFKDFGKKRTTCQRRCMINRHFCNFCETQLDYLQLMEKTTDKMNEIKDVPADVDNPDESIKDYIGETEGEIENYDFLEIS